VRAAYVGLGQGRKGVNPGDGDGGPLIPAIDTSVAHAARIYDYYLGGVDNFEVDRVVAEHAAAVHPGGMDTVRASVGANRAFLVRSVRWLAREAGVRQFFDIGSGIPNRDNVHAVAQEATAGSRVVYVDNDPVVLAHAHRLLSDDNGRGRVAYLRGDLREPDRLLRCAAADLDFSEPVALMLLGVLHFLPDHDPDDADADPYRIVGDLVDRLVSGSFVVVSHLACDIHPAEMAEVARRFNETTAETWALRNRDEVEGFFAGVELIEPGVVGVDGWRPEDSPGPVLPPEGRTNPLWVGVGRKP
jgi:hypothetical protein